MGKPEQDLQMSPPPLARLPETVHVDIQMGVGDGAAPILDDEDAAVGLIPQFGNKQPGPDGDIPPSSHRAPLLGPGSAVRKPVSRVTWALASGFIARGIGSDLQNRRQFS